MFARKQPKTRASNTKVTTYMRDIICLPKDYTPADRIPRGERAFNSGTKMALLASCNLILACQQRKYTEICSVFSKPMGLSDPHDPDQTFPFQYLQRAGAGSRSLCCPSISESFQWSGIQVAFLTKGGGYIYILAKRIFLMLSSKHYTYCLLRISVHFECCSSAI